MQVEPKSKGSDGGADGGADVGAGGDAGTGDLSSASEDKHANRNCRGKVSHPHESYVGYSSS